MLKFASHWPNAMDRVVDWGWAKGASGGGQSSGEGRCVFAFHLAGYFLGLGK